MMKKRSLRLLDLGKVFSGDGKQNGIFHSISHRVDAASSPRFFVLNERGEDAASTKVPFRFPPRVGNLILLSIVAAIGLFANVGRAEVPTEAVLKTAVELYFNDLFGRLEKVAVKAPTEASFREVMRPQIEKIDGLFGASLINADWEIRAVYFKRDFLAVGFSLKKVKELDGFRTLMAEHPTPQLSEPGHGSLLQPRLISLRYPVLKDGKMISMVSILIRTESFLKAVGLNQCKAYKIICLGKDAESKGTLSEQPKVITIALPSTEWAIQYE